MAGRRAAVARAGRGAVRAGRRAVDRGERVPRPVVEEIRATSLSVFRKVL